MKRLFSVLATAILAVALTGAATAQSLPRPTSLQQGEARLIAELLSQYHIRDQAVNDDLSRAVYRAYFDALDPQRYYFLASDIQSFSGYRTELDEMVRNGRLDPAWEIFNRYYQRVRERVDYALSLLDGDFIRNGEGRFQLDRDDADWAASSDELDALWRKRVRHDALTLRLNDTPWSKVRETLRGRYERMARTLGQYRPEDIFQTFMNAWAGRYDPHTSYLSPRRSENFDINMSLSLEGIGALLKGEGAYTEIVELIPGGPASGSGELSPGDRIIGVAQGDGRMVDVVGWRLSDVVELIRGPRESVVRLRVLPSEAGGSASPEVVKLTRNRIELEEQAASSRVIDVDEGLNARRIGVITIPAFYMDFQAAEAGKKDYRSTSRDVADLIDGFDGKVDGIVLDLRGDAGGSLEEATRVAGLFVPEGPMVQVRRSSGDREVLRDKDDGTTAYDGPLTVLVDRFSASASEIVAGALQDYGRAVIAGDRTFGKGTVQTLVDLERFGLDGDEPTGRLKMTVAKFYRITGHSTQLRGVEPDIDLPIASPDETGERATDNPLPWDEIDDVAFHHRAAPLPLERLRERHEERMKTDPALQALAGEVARQEAAQADTTVSLDEAVRRDRADKARAARLEAVNRELEALGRSPVESLDDLSDDNRPDLVLREGARITADLAELTGSDPARHTAAAEE
ncbi:carboxy terminal-processing peptidase [Arhodomonas aquaeolei]|uniref:carboxy terminal-processing peptidase n=1 Tax=Arhodomonas aquaeolei TaxID=2369 RepID=UPI00216A3EEA|nr:carboxy terminal-processing peptidase [Arhodomonas aquaeolei]MCS4503235.1 carboxy terminal-processing peptidase [Arhodomonas aquaeolei]